MLAKAVGAVTTLCRSACRSGSALRMGRRVNVAATLVRLVPVLNELCVVRLARGSQAIVRRSRAASTPLRPRKAA
jgi:Asp/Glu/hydantoin racemase